MKRPAIVIIMICITVISTNVPKAKAGSETLFETAEIRDESTLDVKVLSDWHVDKVGGATRQKLIEIKVAEWWPGLNYRIPVRMIVPTQGKARGFHITGGHSYTSLKKDAKLSNLDLKLIEGGVGVVYTVVQPLEKMPGGSDLSKGMIKQFLKTLNPRYTTLWIWPMTLMRAVTAVYLEDEYFEAGKIAGSGGSKNGAAPAIALINDSRFTATCSSVAPAYASPLRLFEKAAMDQVEAANERFFKALGSNRIKSGEHPAEWYRSNSWGTSERDMHTMALAAGWTWDDIRRLTGDVVKYVFVSENWDQLMARRASVLFQPGTHDWVAYDILWGAQNHPEIPVYYKPNGGHSQTAHPAAENNAANLDAFLIKHFFGGDSLLEPPKTSYSIIDYKLRVNVTFNEGPQPESGRIWWIYDREPGGSAGYLCTRIPDDQWMDMTFNPRTGVWTAVIDLARNVSTIDFFSNHGLQVNGYKAYLSSPYTRVEINESKDGILALMKKTVDVSESTLYKEPDVVYVPTPQDVVDRMLDLAQVKKDDLLYDLGCGDGRIVVTAAKRFGCRAVGYDIDPQRVRESLDNVEKEKVGHLVRIEQKDIFTLDLSKANVITLYLLPSLNVKLIPQLEKLRSGSRVVSHDFRMRGVKPDKIVRLTSSEDKDEHKIFMWTTPLKKKISGNARSVRD